MFSNLYNFISSQFSNPRGGFGSFITLFMNKMNNKQYKSILDNIDIKNNDAVLDIGFGNGYVIEKILKKNPKKAYGIDISQDMLKTTSKKLKSDINSGKLDLKIANVKDLPYDEDFFNKIYTINTMYFWDEPVKSFKEIKRCLKTDGIFLNAFLSKDFLLKTKFTENNFNKYTIDEVKEMMNKADLEIIDIIEISKNRMYCIISK
ncbi:class I SAM-dependent methyltransferase [Methanobrevibacter sp. DSM 116169]|uniref:class I SAM-dependent methyltransferase n=1 Tax=Methanobrevibacter sp. DSM 116169 TaxID=3242727 RepID=UPI0038FC6C50